MPDTVDFRIQARAKRSPEKELGSVSLAHLPAHAARVSPCGLSALFDAPAAALLSLCLSYV